MIEKLIRTAVGYLLLPPVLLKFRQIERDFDILQMRLIVLEGRLVNIENVLLLGKEESSGTAKRHPRVWVQ